MLKWTRRGALAALAAGSLAAVAPTAHAQDAFYKNKRLTVLVNYAAGGPTDVEGRLFARHLARYVDGAPNVIVQNMDGAGGLIGTKFLGEIAPKDGTVVGYLTGAAWQSASDATPRPVDFKTYEFVAYQPGTSVYFARTDIKPGLKNAVDLARAEGVIVGGLGVDNAKDILLRLTMDMLGVKFKYVTGYKGSQGARLALQQGEINLYSESPPSYRGIIEPQFVAKGEAIGLFYDPGYNGVSFRVPKQMEGVDLLPYHELYKKIKGEEPKGELWDAYRTIIALNGAMQRMIVMPPNAPQASIDSIRKAIAAMSNDKDYQDECMKTFGFVPEYIMDSTVNDQVRKALTVTPQMREFIHAYAKNMPR